MVLGLVVRPRRLLLLLVAAVLLLHDSPLERIAVVVTHRPLEGRVFERPERGAAVVALGQVGRVVEQRRGRHCDIERRVYLRGLLLRGLLSLERGTALSLFSLGLVARCFCQPRFPFGRCCLLGGGRGKEFLKWGGKLPIPEATQKLPLGFLPSWRNLLWFDKEWVKRVWAACGKSGPTCE